MRKILITGAGGFIGFHLGNNLAARGYETVGVDLHYPSESYGAENSGFRHLTGDFRNEKLMEEALRDVDVVFHLASAHLQVSLNDADYWDINVHNIRPFMDLSQKMGVKRFVHVSSVGIYGNLKRWPADEVAPFEPQSIYGETKLAGELEAQRFGQEMNFPVVIIRPAWVYGPGCPRTLKIYRALRKGRFIMIGRGNNLRHPIYISDLLDAFLLSMELESAIGEVFIIAGERAITTRELVDDFCRVLGVPRPKVQIPYAVGVAIATCSEKLSGIFKVEPPISMRTLEFFDTNNAFDISKARKTLGFDPKVSFEEGLKHTGDWLRKQ
ncbi:MAG: NAD-dependent epimerase/dehydratase family protein [Deltaproteobacteria bacterium]|nr:NAD-dependent epimerase/dehydratase family protein [Deltaproteobacteria bacterium]